jgi:CheY-like chemotaxis protein
MPTAPMTNTHEESASGVCRRVLVIDDRRDSVLLMRRMLELEGHEVHSAATALEGIELARQLIPDVVLCDIGLPGMSGYELAVAIRSDPICRSIYLVAVSGYGEEEHRRKARDSGFDNHLTKPVSKDQIDKLVSKKPRFPDAEPRDHPA